MDPYDLQQRVRDGWPTSEEEIPHISTILNKSKSDLAALDEEIECLHDRAELEDQRASLQQNMEAHCSLLAPIRKLSSDVLYEILLYACAASSSSEGYLIHHDLPSQFVVNRLSAVCAFWRSILQSHSSFWSSVALRADDRYSHRDFQAKKVIERTGSAPLSVHIRTRGKIPSSHPIYLLANEAYRWKAASLELQNYPLTSTSSKLIQNIHGPILRHLAIGFELDADYEYEGQDGDIRHFDFSSYCPNLLYVSLKYAACGYTALPRKQIEELSLHWPTNWGDSPLVDLGEYSQLRKLCLSGREDDFPLPRTIVCGIRELELTYNLWPAFARFIFSVLRPSALQMLTLKGNGHRRQSTDEQLTYPSIEPMLIHTRATLICLHMDSVFMSETDLISVMSNLSMLEELQLLDCPIGLDLVQSLHSSEGMLPNLERLTMRFIDTELGSVSFQHLITMAGSRWRSREHHVAVARIRVVRLTLNEQVFPDDLRSSLRSLKSSGMNITVRDLAGFVEDVVQ